MRLWYFGRIFAGGRSAAVEAATPQAAAGDKAARSAPPVLRPGLRVAQAGLAAPAGRGKPG
jgi:hypothetical protein